LALILLQDVFCVLSVHKGAVNEALRSVTVDLVELGIAEKGRPTVHAVLCRLS